MELYKALNELFRVKEKIYNLRNNNALISTKYGLNSFSLLAPKIWEIIPNETKSCTSLNLFKEKIKTWIPQNCPGNMQSLWASFKFTCHD